MLCRVHQIQSIWTFDQKVLIYDDNGYARVMFTHFRHRRVDLDLSFEEGSIGMEERKVSGLSRKGK